MKKKSLLIALLSCIQLALCAQNINLTSEYNHITFPENLGVSGGITGDDGTYKKLTFYHGNAISFQTGTNAVNASKTRFYIDADGHVGIGTTIPNYHLHILKDNPSFNIENTNPNYGMGSSLIFGHSQAGTTPVAKIYSFLTNGSPDGRAGHLMFQTANNGALATNMTILNNGNVGIGTTSPLVPFHVSTSMAKTNTSVQNIAFLGSNETPSPSVLAVQLVGAALQKDRVINLQTTENGVENSGKLSLQPWGGNVGIGTTSPGNLLHLYGSDGQLKLESSQSDNTSFSMYSGGGRYNYSQFFAGGVFQREIGWSDPANNFYITRIQGQGNNNSDFVINSVGKVGIGTTSPNAKLSIYGTSVNGTGSQSNISAFSNNSIHIGTSSGGNTQDAIVYQSGWNGGGTALAFGRGSSWDTFLSFYTNSSSNNGTGNIKEQMRLDGNGHLGIGTIDPGAYMLAVNGDTKVRKLKVTITDWSDYVFAPTYKLPTLTEVEAYINKYKHLPDVPSAETVTKEGLDVGDNQAILLKKIEELTLYVIQQQKEIEELKKAVKKK